jgi:hypothetical protein
VSNAAASLIVRACFAPNNVSCFIVCNSLKIFSSIINFLWIYGGTDNLPKLATFAVVFIRGTLAVMPF